MNLKKIINLLLLVLLFIMVGCKEEPNNEYGKKFEFKEMPNEIKIEKEVYNDNTCGYIPYVISDDKNIESFINELKKIKYDERKNLELDITKYIYVVTIDNMEILYAENNYFFIKIEDNFVGNLILEGNFSFLDNYQYEENIYSMKHDFSQILPKSEVSIKKISTNKEASLSISLYIEKINNIRYCLLEESLNKENEIYLIKYNNIEIHIISNTEFILDKKSYKIVEGNFDFLNDLEYTIVVLPWV